MSTTHIAIFVFAVFSLFDGAKPKIIVKPLNTVVVKGDTARLNCSTDHTISPVPIAWGVNTGACIILGCKDYNSLLYRGVPSGQNCDLEVNNVSPTAGFYECYDDSTSTEDKKHTAALLVFATIPTCVLDSPDPVQGQQLNIVCTPGTVTYGTMALPNPPLIQTTICEGLGVSNATIVGAGDVQLPVASFNLTASGTLIESIKCAFQFHFNETYTESSTTFFATNAVNFTVYTPRTRVQYCPTNVTVTPGPYFAGNILNCSAGAYHEPRYSWTNNSNNSPSSLMRTIGLPAGWFDINCTAYATGNLTGVCNATTRVHGFAIECPHDVVIRDKVAVIKVGQYFNCTATSTPAANYTWYNSTGLVSNTQTVSVTTPGPFSLTCNATVTVDVTTCSSNTSDTVNGTAIECPGTMLITPQTTTTTTVRVGDTFNCSTSSYPPANYTWYDSLNVVQFTDRTLTVTKAGNFTYTCNASISVGGTTCFNSTNITGYAISCPPNVTISSMSQPSPVGTVYTCSSDSPSNYTTYTWSDGTTVVHTGSSYTANNTGSFVLTCNATVSVGGISCSNVNSTNITVIEVTTTLWSVSSETATSNNSSGDATASTAQTGGHTASGANTGKAIAYILPPIFALMALLALVLCIPVVARIVRRRAAAAAAAAASKLPAANQIQQRPMNFDRRLPVWSWSESGPTGLYSPGFNATRPDQINGYGRF